MDECAPSSPLKRVRIIGGIALIVASIALSGSSEIGGAISSLTFTMPAIAIGDEVLTEGDERGHAERYLAAYLEQEVRIRIDGETRSRTRRSLGMSLDEASLYATLEEALTPDSDLIAAFRASGGGSTLRIPLEWTIDAAPMMRLLTPEKERLDRSPVEAMYHFETKTVSPERDGRLLDLNGSVNQMMEALLRGETEIEPRFIQLRASRRASDLEGASFDAVLGEFQTRYARTAEARLRTENLVIAAEKIDKTILLPGEEFDFNAVVGPRTAVNGFKPAPVIAAGEIVDGIGGGACQISGTLHAAALFAGLELTERKPHSRPSSYIRMGLDAMVSYPNLNFRFRNDRDFPIAIRMNVKDGFVTATILGPRTDRRTTFVRRVADVTPYPEIEREDPSLPQDVRVLSQRGVPGFKVDLARILRDEHGNELVTERTQDVYPPTTQIWRVGVGAPADEDYRPPAGDRSPEYRAEEYLEMVQGAGVDGRREVKRAGRTGVPGWTIAEGMPSPDRSVAPEQEIH